MSEKLAGSPQRLTSDYRADGAARYRANHLAPRKMAHRRRKGEPLHPVTMRWRPPARAPCNLRGAGDRLATVDGEAPRWQGEGTASVRFAELAATIDAQGIAADLAEMVGDLEIGEEAGEFVEPAFVHLEYQEIDEQRVHGAPVGTGSNAKRVAPVVYLVRDDMVPPEVDRQVITDDPGCCVAMGARYFGAGARAAAWSIDRG
jgi:hypothetical protein